MCRVISSDSLLDRPQCRDYRAVHQCNFLNLSGDILVDRLFELRMQFYECRGALGNGLKRKRIKRPSGRASCPPRDDYIAEMCQPGLHRFPFADVDPGRVAAVGLELRADGLGAPGVELPGHHARAAAREPEGDATADAGPRAGHDGDASVEAEAIQDAHGSFTPR